MRKLTLTSSAPPGRRSQFSSSATHTWLAGWAEGRLRHRGWSALKKREFRLLCHTIFCCMHYKCYPSSPGSKSLSPRRDPLRGRACWRQFRQRSSWSGQSRAPCPALFGLALGPGPWNGSPSWRSRAWWRESLDLAATTACWSLSLCCTSSPAAGSALTAGCPPELALLHVSTQENKIEDHLLN